MESDLNCSVFVLKMNRMGVEFFLKFEIFKLGTQNSI